MASREGTLDLGRTGEGAALERYLRSGYRLLARNWRCRLGEIDLVLVRDGTVVFCEVKTRRGTAYGAPYEAVTWGKQQRLRKLAEAYLFAPRFSPIAVRFDVASVIVDARGVSRVEVLEDAF
jgi:putative endonuclease